MAHSIIHFAKKLTFLFLFLAPAISYAQNSEIYKDFYPNFTQDFKNTHDLSLPEWGLYSKKYNGISHIPEVNTGMRWDLSFHPGFHLRRKSFPANIMYESGYHLWEAAPDLSYYSCRYELEWKDKVYCDLSFSQIDKQSRFVRAEFVNNTDLKQDVVLNLFANINFPPLRPYSNQPIKELKVQLPPNAVWIDATNYQSIGYAVKVPQKNLVWDGHFLGHQRVDNAVNGNVIGSGWLAPDFGVNKGDSLVYTFHLNKMDSATFVLRYRLAKSKSSSFSIIGLIKKEITLIGNGDFQLVQLNAGNIESGKYIIKITSKGDNAIELDGFAIAEKATANDVQFVPVELNFKPEIIEMTSKYIVLKYQALEGYYAISWDYPTFVHRNWSMNSIDEEIRIDMNKFNENFYWKRDYHAQGEDFFNNLFSNLIVVDSNSTKVLNFVVSYGKLDEVKSIVSKSISKPEQMQQTYLAQKAKALNQRYNSAGLPYAFSQQLMSAVTLTNVVYPVFTQNTFIKHNTPGRIWDCLYTWDAGFIGLGLSKLNKGRAFECLNTYTMKPNDPLAFLHHGTPLPVQTYLFLELWNDTQNKEMLTYLYPRMKKYYEFLVGDYGSSTTRNLKSNLIRTWDYFYNSGGWDDYPTQVYIHAKKLESSVAPMVSTSHIIRMAKTLKMAASELKIKADIAQYQSDIAMLTKAIQKNAWDAESGYFGYVMHDSIGNPSGILRTEKGVNYNMGLDGCSPLIAGICTQQQTDAIMKNLFTKGKIWSEQGLSTVDQSAPYFVDNGYWNGSVWMPHQWFLWKTMFDLGRHDETLQIAKKGLEVWKRETEATYNCHEMFPIKSGRSAGWHQFSGLSTPVILWYSAMYKPGNLTTGYDTWVKKTTWAEDFSSLTAELKIQASKGDKKIVWVCLNENLKYNFQWKGKSINAFEVEKGLWTLEILSTENTTSGTLICSKK